jgi:hypothetical protein
MAVVLLDSFLMLSFGSSFVMFNVNCKVSAYEKHMNIHICCTNVQSKHSLEVKLLKFILEAKKKLLVR